MSRSIDRLRERRRSSASRSAEAALAAHFLRLAEALGADDVVDLLDQLVHSCLDLLGVSAAGILLVDRSGELQVMSSSSEEARLLELFQLQSRSGPCVEAFRSGGTVTADVRDADAGRWSGFAEAAAAVGFRRVHALPLSVHDEVVGALNLFREDAAALTDAEAAIAQALTQVASVGIVQQRHAHASSLLAEQLQTALSSRVVIEQAKGMLAAQGLSMDDAFGALRSYARNGNHKLAVAAEAVVRGSVDPGVLAHGSGPR